MGDQAVMLVVPETHLDSSFRVSEVKFVLALPEGSIKANRDHVERPWWKTGELKRFGPDQLLSLSQLQGVSYPISILFTVDLLFLRLSRKQY
jgi:hypothetical protein